MEPRDLPVRLLMEITEYFCEERKIRETVFGMFYKGILSNRTVVVKSVMDGLDDEVFDREVNNLMKINHPNVVRFLAFCSNTEYGARLLCFEYIGNGSLDEHITDELRGLEWNTRYEIIRGICHCLQYLHNEKHIMHMGLCPDNVLLDNHMVPKLGGFEMSRSAEISVNMDRKRYISSIYNAPECLNDDRMSIKSDIYSLGVLIIHVVTG